MTYQFEEFCISDTMLGDLKRYVEHRIPPCDFIEAVICNDLREAVGRADHNNMRNLPAFVSYLYNEAPRNCWGSKEIMTAWLKE